MGMAPSVYITTSLSSPKYLVRQAGTLNGSTSELRYTPATERDYGALSCRGANAVGRQALPCVLQVVPAGEVTTWPNYIEIYL